MWLPVRKSGVVIGLSLLLSACGVGKYSALQENEPAGTDFQVALAYEYQAYAYAKHQSFQAFDVQYFSDKGLKSSYGQEVFPETLGRWDIQDGSKAELFQSREYLMDVFLTGGVKEGMPEQAARTQALFDCWVEQEEQGVDVYDESCRPVFLQHLDVLLAYKKPKILIKEIVNEEAIRDGSPVEQIAAADLKAKFPLPYTVLFKFNKASLTPEGLKILNMIARDVKTLQGYESYEIVVNGHADRAGSRSYNLKLSQKRAQMVKNYLIERGLDPTLITFFAFGEMSPKVQTRDGVRNQANRRVEIILRD